MPDLKAVLEAAARREQSSASPRYEDLLSRAERRRRRRVVAVLAGTVLLLGASAVLIGARAPSHTNDALRADTAAPACGASDVGELEAKWTLRGLVLNGSMTVRNVSAHACRLGPPDVELQSATHQPLLSEERLIPVDFVAPVAVITIPPGRAAQAVLNWGGGYCDVPTPHVVLAVRLPNGIRSANVAGAVLPCLSDVTYYRHGQSSAAVSGFRVIPG
ncbi:MAG: hypothetical protein JWM40_1609 [Frankiales bacterium]|nr:hypothetical protein [Frankiales bacterium]